MELKLIQTTPETQAQVWFADQGPKLAVYHHGIPRPRQLTEAELAVFAEFGYSVAAPIRPGYLLSTPVAPRAMAADSPDTAHIVEQLGFKEFVSLGFSGGGPRALADVLLLPNATGAATFGSVAAPHLDYDFFGQMPAEERESVMAMKAAGLAMLPQFESWAAGNPDLNVGAAGWLNDELSMVTDWGFDPAEITRPVVLTASAADQNVPLEQTRWLHRRIKGSVLLEPAGLDHDHIFNPETIREALTRL